MAKTNKEEKTKVDETKVVDETNPADKTNPADETKPVEPKTVKYQTPDGGIFDNEKLAVEWCKLRRYEVGEIKEV